MAKLLLPKNKTLQIQTAQKMKSHRNGSASSTGKSGEESERKANDEPAPAPRTPRPASAPAHPAPAPPNSARLHEYVRGAALRRLLAAPAGGPPLPTAEEEVWLLRCPADLDVGALVGARWAPRGGKLKLQGSTYEMEGGAPSHVLQDAEGRLVALPVTELRLRRRVPEPRAASPSATTASPPSASTAYPPSASTASPTPSPAKKKKSSRVLLAAERRLAALPVTELRLRRRVPVLRAASPSASTALPSSASTASSSPAPPRDKKKKKKSSRTRFPHAAAWDSETAIE